ncbi:MAG TPA: phosphotransferase, partial [Microlunatus sp.]
ATAWFADLDATAQLPGLDPATWLSADETSALLAALPRLVALGQQLAVGPVPVTLLHGDLHVGNVAIGRDGPLLYDWTDACLGHPFFDLVTALHGTDETRRRLRDAYLSGWADHAAPQQLAETWRAAEILAPLHHAVSYRAIAAACAPPVDAEMATATAFWLRSVLAALNATA